MNTNTAYARSRKALVEALTRLATQPYLSPTARAMYLDELRLLGSPQQALLAFATDVNASPVERNEALNELRDTSHLLEIEPDHWQDALLIEHLEQVAARKLNEITITIGARMAQRLLAMIGRADAD